MCSCTGKEQFDFKAKGLYTVALEGSDVEFRAAIDGLCREYTFTAPQSICGLSALTLDGVSYSVKYGELSFEASEIAIKAATDFGAAMEFLESTGEYSGGRIYAEVDGISAEGLFDGKQIVSLAFYDGKNGRNYKITTEASG